MEGTLGHAHDPRGFARGALFEENEDAVARFEGRFAGDFLDEVINAPAEGPKRYCFRLLRHFDGALNGEGDFGDDHAASALLVPGAFDGGDFAINYEIGCGCELFEGDFEDDGGEGLVGGEGPQGEG